MQYYDVLTKQFGPIVVSCLISTLIIMVVVAYSSHMVHRERIIGEATDGSEEKK